ncbi:Ubiquitin-conjugating enzyme E2 G1 isoform X1 [Oopsacas minuta]|uniref:E2 ubiquitin-conjugating enzyme n=1 Tax=Oopsacas minuta TaxID=111878 RepID=A0AAV7JXZ3_9METZ|nr:Ubiquitin-conjugating enzyme E2 G1 isoform X1 [Oopsacas minuta]
MASKGLDQGALLLKKQLADLQRSSVDGFSAGLVDDNNLFVWEVLIVGPPDTLYEGGFFKAHLNFPKEFPLKPPKMKFISNIWHPNVYADGEVCISILHEPGEDKFGYEKASERWSPVHTVESVVLSVISMLSDPNPESAANIVAAKEVRDSPAEFKRHVRKCVRQSQDNL